MKEKDTENLYAINCVQTSPTEKKYKFLLDLYNQFRFFCFSSGGGVCIRLHVEQLQRENIRLQQELAFYRSVMRDAVNAWDNQWKLIWFEAFALYIKYQNGFRFKLSFVIPFAVFFFFAVCLLKYVILLGIRYNRNKIKKYT